LAHRKPGKRSSDARNLAELRSWYNQVSESLTSCKAELKIANTISREDRKDLNQQRGVTKAEKRKVITLTAKVKAQEELKKSTAWSAAAGTCTTILYQVWGVVGYPGGWKFRDVWEHEATNSAVMFVMTLAFAWCYKLTRD